MSHIVKIISSVAMMLAMALSAAGQDIVDAVYLKNGSVVRGTMLEMRPTDSLTIKTSDGHTLVLDMGQVERVAKEKRVYMMDGKTMADDWNSNSDKRGRKSGYRGFVELGYTFGMGSNGSDRMQLMTSHGYQFSPFFFAGLGVGYHYFREGPGEGMNGVPVYAHLRSEFMDNTVAPYLDIKFGYAFGDPRGIYFEPTLGCHIVLNSRFGLSIGVGYTVQDVDFNHNGLHWCGGQRGNLGGLCAKVAVDF